MESYVLACEVLVVEMAGGGGGVGGGRERGREREREDHRTRLEQGSKMKL